MIFLLSFSFTLAGFTLGYLFAKLIERLILIFNPKEIKVWKACLIPIFPLLLLFILFFVDESSYVPSWFDTLARGMLFGFIPVFFRGIGK